MQKKLFDLLEKIHVTIEKEEVNVNGRYTIVKLIDSRKKEYYGASRLSDDDIENRERGINIARGRAYKAMYLKLNNKKLNEWYLG
jgi:hypothetical protein